MEIVQTEKDISIIRWLIDKAVFNYAGQKKIYGRIVEPEQSFDAPRKIDHEESSLDYRKLLDEDEELEVLADQIASNVEREFEKKVLDDILYEIRNV